MSVIVVTTTSYAAFKDMVPKVDTLAYVANGSVSSVTVFDAEHVGVIFAVDVAEATFLGDYPKATKVDTITVG